MSIAAAATVAGNGQQQDSVSLAVPSAQLVDVLSTGENQQPIEEAPKKTDRHRLSSKYDFVKVRVWLEEHYYVLSRFLVSRMLSSTRIAYDDSIKIALELKKRLVDANLLDVQQRDMETQLFDIMRSHHYGDEAIQRFQMMTRFHQLRVPMVILIGGTACTGKSTLATQLAERLNLPNVLQTDIVHEMMMMCLDDSSLQPNPAWFTQHPNSETLLEQYRHECRLIRKGLQSDIQKAFEEGKSIIVEGSHLDPSLFMDIIKDCNLIDIAQLQASSSSSSSSSLLDAAPPISPSSAVASSAPSPPALLSKSAEASSSSESSSAPAAPAAGFKKKGVVVPFILLMDSNERRLFIDHWISSRSSKSFEHLGDSYETKLQSLLSNFSSIQDYLRGCCEGSGVEPIDVNLHSFHDSLDRLHSVVLERIEFAYKQGKLGF